MRDFFGRWSSNLAQVSRETSCGTSRPENRAAIRPWKNFDQRPHEPDPPSRSLEGAQPRRLVLASGDNPVVIRADRHSIDQAIVATQNERISRRIFRIQVPQPRRLVPASGDNPAVIRADATVIIGPSALATNLPPIKSRASLNDCSSTAIRTP